MTNFVSITRPLIYFDIESTGNDVRKDRIIELSTIKVDPDGYSETITQRFNPGIPIQIEATAVHGIKNEDVINEPKFSDRAKQIYDYFLDCDLAGYNILGFDIRILSEELLRAGFDLPFDQDTKIIDGMRIFHKMEKRDLATAYQFYCKEELINAHQAEADTLAAMKVIKGQIEKYDFEPDINYLAEISKYDKDSKMLDFASKFVRDLDGNIVFNFSNNKGKKVLEELGMLKWMLDKDFDLHTIHIAKQILEGKIR